MSQKVLDCQSAIESCLLALPHGTTAEPLHLIVDQCSAPQSVHSDILSLAVQENQEAPQQQPTIADSLQREVYRLRGALPALAMRCQVQTLLEASQWLVIKGETGSGKSTQLPQYLADRLGAHGQASATILLTGLHVRSRTTGAWFLP